jgi:hypothetical protein
LSRRRERRIDVIEFHVTVRALGDDPAGLMMTA